jgi:formylglycine-generating enzyme required for sulfatase activity
MSRKLSVFLSSSLMIGVILLDRQVFAQSPKEIINSIEIKLVLIPNGTFMMGSPIEEEGRYDNEVQHKVTISRDYYLGVTEVTQGQYEKVMGTNPSKFQKQVILNKDSSMYPVEKVSWEDAVSFCKRLSELPDEKTAGRVYRLPTEAEWEYACRAESETAFHFGGSSKLSDDFAWFGNSNKQTHPVGQKKPNAWGLYDMHGNVFEWCGDWFNEYPKGAVSDPTGPKEGVLRVFRGGSWEFGAASGRSATRFFTAPFGRGDWIGFRVALSSSHIPQSPEAGSK